MFNAFSPSKLKTLEKCPLQYYLRYIFKLVQPDLAPKAIETRAGSTFHKILEYMVKLDSLQEGYTITKNACELSPEEFALEVDPLIENFTRFHERIRSFKEKHGVSRILTEARLGIDENYNSVPFFDKSVFFRGIVDLILILKNGDAIIIDHKSGGTSEYGIKNYESQLNPYKVLLLAKTPIESATAGIHFIREGSVPLGEKTSKEDIVNILQPKIKLDIDTATQRVKNDGFFKHVRGSQCTYCDYNEMCKAKQYKPYEDQSANDLRTYQEQSQASGSVSGVGT